MEMPRPTVLAATPSVVRNTDLTDMSGASAVWRGVNTKDTAASEVTIHREAHHATRRQGS